MKHLMFNFLLVATLAAAPAKQMFRVTALERNALGQKLHPQIIQYPAGGGMFGRHQHPLEPQRVGLILGISERGADFKTGATDFEVDGEDIGTDLEPHGSIRTEPGSNQRRSSPGGGTPSTV